MLLEDARRHYKSTMQSDSHSPQNLNQNWRFLARLSQKACQEICPLPSPNRQSSQYRSNGTSFICKCRKPKKIQGRPIVRHLKTAREGLALWGKDRVFNTTSKTRGSILEISVIPRSRSAKESVLWGSTELTKCKDRSSGHWTCYIHVANIPRKSADYKSGRVTACALGVVRKLANG